MRRAWDFDAGREGFGYRDDAFRFTDEPADSGGAWSPRAGEGDGGLIVQLGGRDGADITGMSGGWFTSLTLETTQQASLSFRYNLTQSNNYEPDERSDVMVALDGQPVGGVIALVAGDGTGGAARSTGWQTATIDLGELAAGRHELTFGGFNNKKTQASEVTQVRFDDIVFETSAGGGDTSPGSSGGGSGFGAFEARVLALTNQFRAENDKPPLAHDAKLDAAAGGWSEAMAEGDFFRHSTPAQVEREGYAWRSWGENIAAGYATPEAVVRGWIDSPGHRANLLSDRFQEIGIGHVYLAEDRGSVNYNHYWTQTFGTEASDLML